MTDARGIPLAVTVTGPGLDPERVTVLRAPKW
jgi:hypothetical protein